MSYKIVPVTTLACPKGKTPRCELTGEAATVQLVTDGLTLYYATREHAQQAWDGIVCRIAALLGPLRKDHVSPDVLRRSPAPFIGSEEERTKREYTMHMSKRALVELCQQEASKLLLEGKAELAIPGAVQALTFCSALYGEGAIQMVPPYLLLAEANLTLERLQQAEEFLSLANWTVLKQPDCSSTIRSQLHRDFGKLYSAQGRYADALRELSKDVYHSSLEVGPEHINTSLGYFHMGRAFYGQQRIENALAMFDKVVEVWYKFLASVRTEPDRGEEYTEGQINEGLDMLGRILEIRKKLLGEGHIATGEVLYTLGLLLLFAGKHQEATERVAGAHQVYHANLGAEHSSTIDVAEVLRQLQGTAGQQKLSTGKAVAATQELSPIPSPNDDEVFEEGAVRWGA
eukprot:scaffold7342_cov269-Pinguiococcus_pyrenoidosus.AAC.12